jgi:hypothetical protein
MAAESVQTTFEEASRCPQCRQPGKDVRVIPIPLGTPGVTRGAKIHTILCQNCDFGVWLVQVDPDGSVPPPQDHTKKPKLYIGFEGHDQQARDLMAQIRAGVAHEASASIQEGGYEIRKRKGPDL